ncbi:hypothetical protein [Pontibacter liquoris]|uniref:hypothetical protein n=1 Tax=Pontibacter liquoris TaxID=2905677 RepID=UPI001FA77EF2|nr:hypothetical protein [Pontibacter liquoris]
MEVAVNIRFLLLALYEKKYDGKWYDVADLFTSHHLEIVQVEAKEIVDTLTKDGLIRSIAIGDKFLAQITADGVEFLEESNFFNESTYIPKDRILPLQRELLRHQMDEFTMRMLQSEYGPSIPAVEFLKEVEELKALLNILGQKSWLQIMKSKFREIFSDSVPQEVLEEMLRNYGNYQAAEHAAAG